MEGFDSLVIDINEADIVQILQTKMRRVVGDAATLMAAEEIQEPLEGRAVEEILARMQLETDVHAVLLVEIQDRTPPTRQLLESLLDQPGGTRRPRVDIRPGETARESDMRLQSQIPACPSTELNLFHRPS